MMEPILPASSVASLLKFLLQWLRSLSEASAERKAECVNAIDGVLVGVRRTEHYIRARKEGGANLRTEGELAEMWTSLGFQLEALGVRKLAKRCDVKGQYWASPQKFSEEWWAQADIGLDSVARLARQIKAEVQSRGVRAG